MVNIAIVGVGRIGTHHGNKLVMKVIKNARLIAVCDNNSERLKKFQEKHPDIQCFEDYKELLSVKELDAVIVATQHYFHPEIAIFFLENKIHTLVEKPIGVTTLDAKRMIKASEENPEVIFALMYNQRTNKLYRRAKEMIDAGDIGTIQRASYVITSWYRSQSYYDKDKWRGSWSGEGGGMVINQCIHQLDLIQWLLGMPKSISATCKTVERDITTENDVKAIFKYEDFDLTFTGSTHELPGVNQFEIVGDKGTITIRSLKAKVSLLEKSEKVVNAKTNDGSYGSTGVKKFSYTYGLWNYLIDRKFGQHFRVIKQFANAIENHDKNELVAEGREGINALVLTNGIYLSNWLNEEVELPFDDYKYSVELEKRVESELE